MAGLPYDPIMQLSTPVTRLAVMEGRTLSIGAYGTKLDDDFRIVADSEDERRSIEAGMKAVEERIESEMARWAYNPYVVNGKAVPVCTAVTFIYSQK